MTRDEFLYGVAQGAENLAGDLHPEAAFPPVMFVEDWHGDVRIVPGHPGWIDASPEHADHQAHVWAAACKALRASRVVCVHGVWTAPPSKDERHPIFSGDPDAARADGMIEALLLSAIDPAGGFGLLGVVNRDGEHPQLVEWWMQTTPSESRITTPIAKAMGWR